MFLSLNTVLKVNLKKEETVENQGQLQQTAPHTPRLTWHVDNDLFSSPVPDVSC